MTAKQLRALEAHAVQLDRRAAQARSQWEKVRGVFSTYGAPSVVSEVAARAADHAIDDAREFRRVLAALAAAGPSPP